MSKQYMKNTFKSLQEHALLRVIPTMTFQDIYFTWIQTSILTFNLAYILTFNLAYILIFNLAYILTFNLTYILTFYLTYILIRNLAFYLIHSFWQFIWHSIWHSIWHDILSKYNIIIESSDEQGYGASRDPWRNATFFQGSDDFSWYPQCFGNTSAKKRLQN